jgi:hypothetical protein
MDVIKKLVTIIILLVGAAWYYNHNQATVDGWLEKNSLPNPTQLLQQAGGNDQLKQLQDQVSKKWTAEFVQDQLAQYVIKDGISLPEGWKLEQRKINDKNITVIVPAEPENAEDYIVPRVQKTLVDSLPVQHLCKKVAESEKTTTCVVGSNLETHRVFHVLTFL